MSYFGKGIATSKLEDKTTNGTALIIWC